MYPCSSHSDPSLPTVVIVSKSKTSLFQIPQDCRVSRSFAHTLFLSADNSTLLLYLPRVVTGVLCATYLASKACLLKMYVCLHLSAVIIWNSGCPELWCPIPRCAPSHRWALGRVWSLVIQQELFCDSVNCFLLKPSLRLP